MLRDLLIGSALIAVATSAPSVPAFAAPTPTGPAGVPRDLPGPAEPAAASDLSLTIYNSDLALVQDHRRVEVPAGRSRLELKDVSAAIRPETAALTGEGLSVREQNFDFDLLTPAKMMEKAVGHQVQIVRTNPGDGKESVQTATVLAANDGVVLQVGDHVEVLRDDGVPTRVIFDRVPQTLRAQPTLSVMVDADRAGSRAVDLSYLTTGLSWKADYVALFDEARGMLDLQGWVTLTNTSGTGFADAKTVLVAGDVQLDSGPEQPWRARRPNTGILRAGTEGSDTPGIGDFHLYPLPERTTVADKQTKQVGIISAKGVQAHKVYRYEAEGFASQSDPQHVDVAVDFTNSTAGGLGRPLPAGTVRVYQRDAEGRAQFMGESPVGHTPQGSDLSLKIGEAFDVTVQPTLVSNQTSPESVNRYAMSYAFHNAEAQAVTVELRQDGLEPDGEIVKESQHSRRLDASSRVWTVSVPAKGEATLTFTARTGE